ncbi:MAG: transporter substrate-binding domain-containing protein, partial [Bacteroidota bacterium]
MNRFIKINSRLFLIILTIPLIFGGCRRERGSRRDGADHRTEQVTNLERIREKGVLKVVTEFNSTSYFIYRGQPMGFQFELLNALANHLALELEVHVCNDLQQNFRDLTEGEVDLIAMNLTVTSDRKQLVGFTLPLQQTRQVLVQRKPEHWEKMNQTQLETNVLRNQLNLAGKTIYVQSGSVHASTLMNLSDEIGGGIQVREVELESEQLIQRVALGEIDYTVCDENVGLVNNTYFPVLDVKTAISFPQNMAWAVHLKSDSLKAEIDDWIRDYRETRSYTRLYNKYFKNRHTYRNIHSEYYALGSGRISKYDEILKKESESIHWDWRLLASMVYQESRFNPEAVSWAGAFGLMQLMPRTARNYGVTIESSPRAQVRAGIQFIQWLDERFREVITDDQERLSFILAAYNVGYGHIQDARRLAEKNGSDPNLWIGNVEEWILKKSDPVYYNDKVVKYGYARGSETYHYVREVLERYEHYKNIINSDVIASSRPVEE